MTRYSIATLAVLLVMTIEHATAAPATAIFAGESIRIDETLADPVDLWVSPDDLTRINGFEIKREGACLDAICIPLAEGDSKLRIVRNGQTWVNVTQLARLVNQPFVYDTDARVWSFGSIPNSQTSLYGSAIAPDFALQDRSGKTVRLSDFRGKKVLLMTWASW